MITSLLVKQQTNFVSTLCLKAKIMWLEPSWLSGWHAGVGILCPRGTDSIPVVTSYLVWKGGQWCNSVSSARVDPALNGYLEKSGEGQQEGFVKAQDGWPPAPHCTSWLKDHETEISTAGLDFKGLVPSYLLTFFFMWLK